MLHIERAWTGSGSWEIAQSHIRRAVAGPIDTAEHVGLYYGAPAIAFMLHTASDRHSRYRAATGALDEHVLRLTRRRLATAAGRIKRGEPATFAEFDLFYGLTGIGALLLRRSPGSDILAGILRYVISLTEPRRQDDVELPGWWVAHDPDEILPTPGGHANFGMAHGAAGLLALLALATAHGCLVDGQHEAITVLTGWFDRWRQDCADGPWWPQWITREELRTGHPTQPGPGRPSWCYGTVGIARAQQLAAIAIDDLRRQEAAENALAASLTDTQLDRITEPGLCHGIAGVYQTAYRAARDARNPAIGRRLPLLAARLVEHAGSLGDQGGRGRAADRRRRGGPGARDHPAHRAATHGMGRMPADHLTTTSPYHVAAGVLAVLAGADLEATAAASALDPTDLHEALRLYQAAGLAALERHADHDWYQVRVQFPDWSTAETVGAAQLGPRLDRLQASGAVAGWWFLRKHPCWRLRLYGADTAAVDHVLDELTTAGVITRWWPAVYEPETAAFGGPAGMATAHGLFCADTRSVLDYLRHDAPGLGRRELSILLLSGLLRAAGLDGFECGDVFDKAARLRPAPAHADAARIEQLAANVRILWLIPDLSDSALFTSGGPVAHAAPWLAAFQTAGRQLGDAAAQGRLDRGVRAILTHVLIFHWNRLGLSTASQGILARAATTALLPRS